MRWEIVILGLGMILAINGIIDAYGTHIARTSQPCSVRADGEMLPVLYGGQPRNNPDGSFYPADSFYYLIQFSASSTCVGMRIDSLKSYDGLDVDFHDMVSWNLLNVKWKSGNEFRVIEKTINPINIMKVQQHIDLTRAPKQIVTIQYFDDNDRYLFSLQSGESLSYSQKRLLRQAYSTNSTTHWDFGIDSSPHRHPEKCLDDMLNDPDATRNRNILTDRHGKTCQIEDIYVDATSLDRFHNIVKSKCSVIKVYSGCLFGKISINDNTGKLQCLYSELREMGIPKDRFPELDKCVNLDQKIEQKITGSKLTCSKNSYGKTVCKVVPVVKTVTFRPDILAPDLNLILTKEVLPDSDGYDTRNLDGTYYQWDPITLRHVPDLKWKNNRANTIHFEIEKKSDLRLEKEIECVGYNTCDMPLEHTRVSVTRWHLGNGDGLTIYNATTPSDLGLHNFIYHVTAYNNEIVLNFDTSTIPGLVVQYDPQYSQYPYSLLADDKRTAYENRAAVALHYFGSVGGSPDDIKGLHEDRRSKINNFTYVGIGFDPWIPRFFNDTLSWSSAHDVGILSEHNKVKSNYTVISNVKTSDIIPCDVKGMGTAMLIKAGYCKVFFDYPILDTVIDSMGPRYENATLFNTLLSDNFAGDDRTYLSHYEYRFPESFFNANLHVVSYDANHTTNSTSLQVKVLYYPNNKTQSITNYISDKVTFDSKDLGFGKIISDDVYPTEYSESGEGELDVKLRRIASKFETYRSDKEQNLTGLDIVRLAPIYLDNSHRAKLAVPLDVGLGSLSPISVIVTAGNQSQEYSYNYIDFSADSEITLNVLQNNQLNVTRYNGITTIIPPQDFGQIIHLYINGSMVNATCNITCTINTLSNSEIQITAENSWGGKAHIVAEEFVLEPKPSVPDLTILVLFALSLPIFYMIYQRVKNHK